MEDIIISILSNVLLVIMTTLAGLAVPWIVARIGTEKAAKLTAELLANQELALAAVRYAQQCYWAQSGYLRYAKASEWLAEQALNAGFKITVEQIKVLIESALRTLKDEFGEEWAKEIKPADDQS